MPAAAERFDEGTKGSPKAPRRKDLIIVMGVQRSGTSALFKSLASDPAVTAFGEDIDNAIYHCYRLRPLKEIAPLLEAADGPVLLKPLNQSLEELRSCFGHEGPYRLRIVWIYRDPVNVLYSMHRQGWTPLDGICDSPQIEVWNRRNLLALQPCGSAPEQITIIRYEDLIADRRVFRRLAAWLGLKSTPLFQRDSCNGRRIIPRPDCDKIDAATADTLHRLDAARMFRSSFSAGIRTGALRALRPHPKRRGPDRGKTSWASPLFSHAACSPSRLAGLRFWLDAPAKLPETGIIAGPVMDFGPGALSAQTPANGPYHLSYVNGKAALFYPHERVNTRRRESSGILHFGAGKDWAWLAAGQFSMWALFRPNVPCYDPYQQWRSVLLRVGINTMPLFVLEWNGRVNATSAVFPRQRCMGAREELRASTEPGSHPRQEWRLIAVTSAANNGRKPSIFCNGKKSSSLVPNPTAPRIQEGSGEPGLQIGGDEADRDTLFYGAVAEVVFFDRVLEEGEQLGLTRYFKEKYRL